MITSIAYNGIKLYSELTIKANQLSAAQLQGYNFDKLLNVVLSANNLAALPSLTCIDIFKRQPPISGALIEYIVLDKNNLLVKIPRLIEECKIQFIPYNVAGYSESSKTLFSPHLSADNTLINVYTPVITTYIRSVSSFTYRRLDGRSLFLRPT